MEIYTPNIDSEIERLLETSSIAPLLKAILKASLYNMSYESKLSVLQSLRREQQKLFALKKKQEQIIDKYRGIMEKLSKDSNL